MREVVDKKIKCQLIDVEGIDGSGKTTQAMLLKKFLESKGFPVELLKEPTNGSIGVLIRKILREDKNPDPHRMAKLYADDRYENYIKYLKPALSSGKIVVMDRYVISSMAYQCAGGVPLEKVIQLNDFAPKPDLVIIIDLPVEVALERMKAMGKNVDSFERKEFLKKVREKYIQLPKELKRFKGWENTVFKIVDGTKKPELVFEDIKRIVIECVGDP